MEALSFLTSGLARLRIGIWERKAMGLASYLEDIRKVRDDAEHLRLSLRAEVRQWTVATAPQSIEDARKSALRQVEALAKKLDQMVAQMDGLLALATEPELDLASETIRLRAANTQLLTSIESLKRDLAKKKVETAGWQERLKKEQATNTDLRRKLRLADERMDRRGEVDFGSLVEAYPPPRGRR